MKCAHQMPFGAALSAHDVRFRLWAPAVRRVDLKLEGEDEPELVEMANLGDGWHELVTSTAQEGTHYRFRIDQEIDVPDPASRRQAGDVHAASVVVDPARFDWKDKGWRGRPWHEAVLYELHVGTFTPPGRFVGVSERLDYLADLGVTAIELMPVADFSGRRNWGYDGVLPYAPASAYGTPDDLKSLVEAAHQRGLMVLLDVVYNHFGPDGNYLGLYAPQFFTDRVKTPWGSAIDFKRREVRDFFIHNALYWLEEYRFDGLRLDAVHAIFDSSAPDILEELAQTVLRRFEDERKVHLILENEHNAAHYLARREDGRPRYYVAQWNDDIHHAFHVLATGERAGYYDDYIDRPIDRLGRCLAEGFGYQGEPSRYHDGAPRGQPSADLPPTAFVAFLQNHDQIGNRAFGQRLVTLAEPRVLKALVAIVLLAPSPPLVFMGEEWGADAPFLFFCDFRDALADAVRRGRRTEFARLPEFADPQTREKIPDPNAVTTFEKSRLDWRQLISEVHADWLSLYRDLLHLRAHEIVPRLAALKGHAGRWDRVAETGLHVRWQLGEGSELVVLANLGPRPAHELPIPASGRLLYASDDDVEHLVHRSLLPWSVAWFLL